MPDTVMPFEVIQVVTDTSAWGEAQMAAVQKDRSWSSISCLELSESTVFTIGNACASAYMHVRRIYVCFFLPCFFNNPMP